MKEVKLLIWLTQLGLSAAVPPFLLIWLAVYLRDHFGWGSWVIWAGIVLSAVMAIDCFRSSLKAMERLAVPKCHDHS